MLHIRKVRAALGSLWSQSSWVQASTEQAETAQMPPQFWDSCPAGCWNCNSTRELLEAQLSHSLQKTRVVSEKTKGSKTSPLTHDITGATNSSCWNICKHSPLGYTTHKQAQEEPLGFAWGWSQSDIRIATHDCMKRFKITPYLGFQTPNYIFIV